MTTRAVNTGMDWNEAEIALLRSRKLGVYGASKAVKPRTIAEYQWDLKQFFGFMQSRQVTHYNQAGERDILDYVEHLQGNGWSKATQRKYLISLKTFLRWVDRDPDCKAAQMKSHVALMPVSRRRSGGNSYLRLSRCKPSSEDSIGS